MADVIKVVSIYDPAIDLDHSDMDAYCASRDVKHLRFHKGKQPAVFSVRKIPRSVHVKYIEALMGDHARHTAAFECGVVQVENLASMDGTTVKLFEPEWMRNKDRQLVGLTDDELEMFHPNDIFDIGGVAYDRCFLRPGSKAHFAAPRGVERRLGMERRPPVDEVLSELKRLNDESSADSTTPDEGASAEPGGATAKASAGKAKRKKTRTSKQRKSKSSG